MQRQTHIHTQILSTILYNQCRTMLKVISFLNFEVNFLIMILNYEKKCIQITFLNFKATFLISINSHENKKQESLNGENLHGLQFEGINLYFYNGINLYIKYIFKLYYTNSYLFRGKRLSSDLYNEIHKYKQKNSNQQR